MIAGMNPQSLDRANAFLAAVAARTQVGSVLPGAPADIGHELAFPDPLATARAVRALIARRRLEAAEGSYRLLDARPVDPKRRKPSVGGRASHGERCPTRRQQRRRGRAHVFGHRARRGRSPGRARARGRAPSIRACERRARKLADRARLGWRRSNAPRRWARRLARWKRAPRWPRRTSERCWHPCEDARPIVTRRGG